MSAFKSFDGMSEPGPGNSRQLAYATSHHTMAVMLTGSGTATAILEGSHDGYAWFPMGAQQVNGESPVALKTTPPGAHLVTWVRASLAELTGDQNTTAAASIASADD
jgi:hypothetical protein